MLQNFYALSKDLFIIITQRSNDIEQLQKVTDINCYMLTDFYTHKNMFIFLLSNMIFNVMIYYTIDCEKKYIRNNNVVQTATSISSDR